MSGVGSAGRWVGLGFRAARHRSNFDIKSRSADFRSGSEQHESEKTVHSRLHGPDQTSETRTPPTQKPVPVGFGVLLQGFLVLGFFPTIDDGVGLGFRAIDVDPQTRSGWDGFGVYPSYLARTENSRLQFQDAKASSEFRACHSRSLIANGLVAHVPRMLVSGTHSGQYWLAQGLKESAVAITSHLH